MRLGERVRSTIALPSIPSGSIGVVEETGTLFIAVRFEDGRIGHYPRRQLARAEAASNGLSPITDLVDLGFPGAKVAASSHICLLPSSEEQARRTVAEYCIAGARAGDVCICCAGRCWTRSLRSLLNTAVREGRMRADSVIYTDAGEFYLAGASFTADKQLARVAEALSAYSGRHIRVMGRPGRAMQGMPEHEWWDYETRVTHLLRDHGCTAVCTYQRDAGSVALRAEAVHPYAIKQGQLVTCAAAAR